MTQKPIGTFLVSIGETITVTVTASDTKYLAAIGPLSNPDWTEISPPSPVPASCLKQVGKFKMTTPTNNFGITFVFLPPPGSAPVSYHVNIVGDAPGGGPFDDDIANPGSPVPPVQVYTFVTS